MKTHHTLALAASFAIAGALTFAIAGPVNPPAGPIAPTFKTLAEVEPRIAINATNTPGDASNLFKINQSGSYYLTGDIVVPTGKNGIRIAGVTATIDLNGFTISGAGNNGILSEAVDGMLTVRNGKF